MAKASATQQSEVIHLFDPQKDLLTAKIKIAGDSPLMLNKYTRGTLKDLTDTQTGKAKKGRKDVQKYYEIIERIHWLNPLPAEEDIVYDAETLDDLLENNKPCVTGVSLWKAVLSTIVRCGFDTYSTKAKATFRVVDDLVPISFSKMTISEQIVPSKTGQKPILTYRPVFYDWQTEFMIRFTTDIYSTEQILAFINQAGFSNGIGTCRPGTSGTFGMFHIIE